METFYVKYGNSYLMSNFLPTKHKWKAKIFKNRKQAESWIKKYDLKNVEIKTQ